MKFHHFVRVAYFLLAQCACVIKQVKAHNKFCKLWSNRTLAYDLVAVTDDYCYGEGRREDMTLVRAFRKLGRKATRISIQDDDFDWNSTKMVIIRSAWLKYGYIELYNKFQHDIDDIAILMNPLKVIQWQANKEVYLKQLRDAGINTPETIVVRLADVEEDARYGDIAFIQEQLGCLDILLKPAQGNAGSGISRLLEDGEEEFIAMSNEIVEDDIDDAVLFQCFQKQLATKGERGVVFVGGEVLYGIMKQPEEGNYQVNEKYGGTWTIYDPTPEEAAFAKEVAFKVHELAGEMPAYLRVDVFNDNDDNLALMEIAAGTANLFMKNRPEAADVLAAYLDGYLREIEEECEAESQSKTIGSDVVDSKEGESSCTV